MAKKFNFRLDTVLKLRSYDVKLAKEALSQVQAQRISKQNAIDEAHREIASLFGQELGVVSVEFMQQKQYRQEFLKEHIIILEQEKEELLKLEEQRKQELNEANKQEKILLKLKDKKKAEYAFEMGIEDQKNMDEIAINMNIPQDEE